MSERLSSGLAVALGSYPGVVLELAADGRVADSNGRLENRLGRPAVGMPLDVFLEEGSRDRWARILDSAPGDARERPFELFLTEQGGPGLLAFHIFPAEGVDDARHWLIESIPDGAVSALYEELSALNSELVNARRALEKQGAILDHRAREQARIREGAERALHLRDEVLAIVSHDLRNPLAVISTALTFVLEERGLPESVQRRQLEAAARSAVRARQLIDDLLDVASLDLGRPLPVDLESVPLDRLLVEVRDAFDGQAEASGLTLELEATGDLGVVNVDPDRIVQVLGNLLGNALKFTEPGGRITLRARPGLAEVSLDVEDTGPGIPEAELPHLFDHFWQARRQNRAGAGLGLAISKAIVEAHGGTIEVASTVGVGTRFRFTVPRPG